MFDIPDKKSFMDSVHGYIQIPRCFVDNIIDTLEFQRLRLIDQTGMKVLYPSAKHDRFSHSLGVYYLGSIAVDALLSNFKDNAHWNIRSDNYKNVYWAKNKVLFLIACLLHDIGHAPFSHSLECFFEDETPLNDYLKERIGEDIENFLYTIKPHEKMSAWLILKDGSVWLNRIKNILASLKEINYPKTETSFVGEYDKIQATIDTSEIEEDINYIARMILGVKYTDFRPEYQMRNCFIELLNGNYDVDKLDYTIRDTKMSGISNISLDVERLLHSITIIPSTVYVNTTVDLSHKNNILITRLQSVIEGQETLRIKGSLDRPLKLQNCEITFLQGTFIDYFGPNDEESKTISTDGGKVDISSKITIDHVLKNSGENYTTIETLHNNCLIMENAQVKEQFSLKIGDSLYNLKLNENNNCNQIKITTNAKSVVALDGSVMLNGTLQGSVKNLVILSDELGENQEVPTEQKYNGFSLGYNKQAVNLLSNVTEARNYLYLWIYSHHKVAYYANYLLVELARLSAKVANNDTLSRLLFNKINSEEAWRIDDIFIHNSIRIMYDKYGKIQNQEYQDIVQLCVEFFTRMYRHSVYKSLAEFDLVFYRFNTPNLRKNLRNYLEKISELYDEEKFPDIMGDTFATKVGMLKYGKIKADILRTIKVDDTEITKYIDDIVWVSANPSISSPSPSTIYISLPSLNYITTIDRLNILNYEGIKAHDGCYFYLYYRTSENLRSPLKQKINKSIVSFLERSAACDENDVLTLR